MRAALADERRVRDRPHRPQRRHVSVEPPAMWNSSSVPTIRSKKCRLDCSFAVTSALSTKRLSPSPWPATPQRFGR